MVSGWESEGQWFDPWYLQANFDYRLSKKVKNIPIHNEPLMKKIFPSLKD